jgi:small subunit ribosomal protein S27e
MAEKYIIKQPKSKFLKVECKGCGNTQVVFDHASTKVKCLVCDAVLAEPTGGKADVKVPVQREF